MGSVLDENGNVEFGVVESATMNTDGTVETRVSVAFIPPGSAVASGPGMPLVALVATVASGGTLKGGQTLYYAISGEDSAENEGVLSFIIPATIASDSSSVTLTGLDFAPGTSKFNVYRGTTPAALFRIASGQALAGQFTDPGLEVLLLAPADPSFDHANFYWRMEQQPEIAVYQHSPTTVGNSTLHMGVNAYQGMVARITRGTGEGLERVVTSNNATTLTIDQAWDLEPA
jgi:hypothetical protein